MKHIVVYEFEIRMLGRMLRAKREELTGGWRNLHDEELNKMNELSC
jgi:hypothetical protein